MSVHVPPGIAQSELDRDEAAAAVAEQPAKPNWDRIKADYEAGIIPIREIARREGISDTAVAKRAKAHGWNVGLRNGANQFATPEQIGLQTGLQTPVQTKPEPDRRGLDFDWAHYRGDIVVPSQPAIAVYTNPDDAIVIRQEGQYGPDEDHWVYVHRQNLHALIRRLQEFEDEGPVE
jgi:hypothetical protein